MQLGLAGRIVSVAADLDLLLVGQLAADVQTVVLAVLEVVGPVEADHAVLDGDLAQDAADGADDIICAGNDLDQVLVAAGAGALVLDVIITAVPSAVIGFIFSAAFSNHMAFRGADDATSALGGMMWAKLMGIAVGWVYYASMESSRFQGTLGKHILGLNVVDSQLHRVSFGRATGRFFGRILSAIPFGLGFLVQPFTKKRQTWHDMLADCLVVKNTQQNARVADADLPERAKHHYCDPKDKYTHLATLKKLKDDGAITDEEYAIEKKKLLDS